MPRRDIAATAFVLMAFCGAFTFADGPADNNPDTIRPVPKVGIEVSDADRQELEAGLEKLGELLDELRPPEKAIHLAWDCYADVAIFHRAVRIALEDREFFDPKEITAAKKLLETGLERAQQLKTSEYSWAPPWLKQTGLVVRGYISEIDHTVQPYGLVIPESYDFNDSKKEHRLDLWFHGRGETLSEVNFLTQRMTSVGSISPADTIVLHPYGRYCNANKFAGEIDTMEALAAAARAYQVDQNRIAARGFSMGGAACWQFAVHYPQRWFAATPGAGFSETPEFLKFFQKETLNPPWWEEKLWRWYDCPGYVANLKNLNVVAYSGENDIQKQAADIMEAAYEKEGLKLLHLIGPKTGHSIHPDAAKDIESRLAKWSELAGQPFTPNRVDFVTYSLIYPQFSHGRILGLEEQWEEARLTAERQHANQVAITTKNVTAFHFVANWDRTQQTDKPEVIVNGTKLGFLPDAHAGFALVDGAWQAISHPQLEKLQQGKKTYRTCGPIDHAFMSSFIFVKPTGQCAHPEVQKWVDAEMNRAVTQWRRQFRGDVRIKLDSEVTTADLEGSPGDGRLDRHVRANLVLWGDRSSNSVIAKIVDKLPIKWSDAEITVGAQKFDAANHALIAIYPNPYDSRKYIVLNSGFTYREYDYLNNARQTPKLPDWAIVDLRTPPNSRWPGKIVAADFFDEAWQLKPPRKP